METRLCRPEGGSTTSTGARPFPLNATNGDLMKLVIVSNRLPMSVREEEGRLQFHQSPGGLASGLRTYVASPKAVQSEYVWVGWPGGPVRPELRDEAVRPCRQEFSPWPVFLSDQDVEAFYEGFCNNTLWPLFHYFPSLTNYDENYWASYERVNHD